MLLGLSCGRLSCRDPGFVFNGEFGGLLEGMSGSQVLFIKSDPLCNQITVGISPSLSLHTQPSHNVSYRIFLLAPESSAMGGHVCVAHQEHGCFGPTRVAYSERISAPDTDDALKFYLLTLWYPYGGDIGGVLRSGSDYRGQGYCKGQRQHSN